jgi:hypothetical protein
MKYTGRRDSDVNGYAYLHAVLVPAPQRKVCATRPPPSAHSAHAAQGGAGRGGAGRGGAGRVGGRTDDDRRAALVERAVQQPGQQPKRKAPPHRDLPGFAHIV